MIVVTRRIKLVAAVLVVITIAVLAATALWPSLQDGASSAQTRSTPKRSKSPPPSLPMPEPFEIKPMAAAEAVLVNASLPISGEAIESAPPFDSKALSMNELSHRAAADCLTAAIYYEAGNQDERGQRAVAQVVLNRVRHPAFPSSVCAVVYQGADRATGCQFTFTCDGSLRRRPGSNGWSRARKIALAALDGEIEASVGMATHYHANFVVPYWAPSLAKIGNIGTHIFYRWSGYWGKRRAFTQLYSEESASSVVDEAVVATNSSDPGIMLNDGVSVPRVQPLADKTYPKIEQRSRSLIPASQVRPKADEGVRPLLVDQKEHSLKVDAHTTKVTGQTQF